MTAKTERVMSGVGLVVIVVLAIAFVLVSSGCETTTGTVSLISLMIDPTTWENVLAIIGIVSDVVAK